MSQKNVFFFIFHIFSRARKLVTLHISPGKGSNGERVKKCKVLGLFFYDTHFKNCIFSMVALIARRSKYDFWIPDENLILETKIQINFFFRDRKF